jgi:transposase
MSNKYKKFSAKEKVRILRLHLVEKRPISDLCDESGLNPNVFYNWQKQFFENGSAAFEKAGKGRNDSPSKKLLEKINKLQDKLAGLSEIILAERDARLAAAREARKARRYVS